MSTHDPSIVFSAGSPPKAQGYFDCDRDAELYSGLIYPGTSTAELLWARLVAGSAQSSQSVSVACGI
jgi:hypothetical protein